jgi:hypothetical protein
MERRNFLKFGTGAAIGGALTACGGGGGGGAPGPTPTPLPPEPVRTRVVIAWNNVALAALRVARPSPPVAARTLAIVHTAMYNAWAAYDPIAYSTRDLGRLRRPEAEHSVPNQIKAFSFAAYAALLDQFPAQKAAFDAQMAALAYNPAQASLDYNTPEGIGTLSARILLEYAADDGSNQLGRLAPGGQPLADYSGYAPRNAPMVFDQPTPRNAIAFPGLWQPLTYRDTSGTLVTPGFSLPYWGQVRPFALTSGAQFRPGPPAQFGTQEFVDQARYMVNVQVGLTEQHKVMADYWSGATSGESPCAQWSQFAQWVSARDNHSEAQDIKLFFALSNALLDASIAAWDAKRTYDSARPITAIRYLLCCQVIRGYGFDGPAGGLRQIAGEAWVPYHLPSYPGPAFPDHVSGHSTFSMAAAAVLRLFTGSDTFNHSLAVAPRSLTLDPALPSAAVTLNWPTFTYAACEAGTSRVYSGIHFHQADVAGRTLGEVVGGVVFNKARCYWLGQVPG